MFDDAAVKPMRPHQIKAVADTYAAIKRGWKHPILAASVGWGKTRYAAELLLRASKKGHRAVFTVPRNALIRQAVQDFREVGLKDIGVMQADHEMTDQLAQIQVASIHTLVRRPLPDAAFVINDEVHLNTEAFNRIVFGPWRDRIVIGLSATPYRRGMARHWDGLITTLTPGQMIEQGYMIRPRYLIGHEEPKTDGYKAKQDADGNLVYSEDDEAAIMGTQAILGDVVKTWMEYANGLPTFIYAVNLKHAAQITENFERAGIPAGYIDGAMSRGDREHVMALYRMGKIKVLCCYGVLTTGVDEDVRCLVIARIIRSEIQWIQIIGRGTRIDNPFKRIPGLPAKDSLLVIDHGGNLTREDGTAMAPAESIYHDHLDNTDPNSKKAAYAEEKKPLTHRKCPRCAALVAPGLMKCPACGLVIKKSTNSGVTEKEASFGFLGEGKTPKAKKDEKALFWKELEFVRQQRGYAAGWSSHTYRKKFGVWPKGMPLGKEIPRTSTWKYVDQLRSKYAKEHKHDGNPDRTALPGEEDRQREVGSVLPVPPDASASPQH